MREGTRDEGHVVEGRLQLAYKEGAVPIWEDRVTTRSLAAICRRWIRNSLRHWIASTSRRSVTGSPMGQGLSPDDVTFNERLSTARGTSEAMITKKKRWELKRGTHGDKLSRAEWDHPQDNVDHKITWTNALDGNLMEFLLFLSFFNWTK